MCGGALYLICLRRMELLVPSEIHHLAQCKCQTEQCISGIGSETWHTGLEPSSDFSLEEKEAVSRLRKACARKRLEQPLEEWCTCVIKHWRSTACTAIAEDQGQLISTVWNMLNCASLPFGGFQPHFIIAGKTLFCNDAVFCQQVAKQLWKDLHLGIRFCCKTTSLSGSIYLAGRKLVVLHGRRKVKRLLASRRKTS